MANGKMSSSSESQQITADTAFMVTLVSKVFAGMAPLALVDQGEIRLDDYICYVFPEDWYKSACQNHNFS
jgi:CubicO group peptidase (beta-lactamase class C family)